MSNLHEVLGFRPRNMAYYELAFRHSSASLEEEGGFRINNERLEFLGDSVLATAISHHLYDTYPHWDEGQMSQRRGALVKRAVNNMIAEEMELGKMLTTRQDIRALSPDTYGNTLEALIGAVFLDRGYLVAERFVYNKVLASFRLLEDELEEETTNYKSELIEWTQKHHLELDFKVEDRGRRSGGFNCIVFVNKQRIGSGYGHSKKEAHQAASHYALDVLRKADATLKKQAQRKPSTQAASSAPIKSRRHKEEDTAVVPSADARGQGGKTTVESKGDGRISAQRQARTADTQRAREKQDLGRTPRVPEPERRRQSDHVNTPPLPSPPPRLKASAGKPRRKPPQRQKRSQGEDN